MNYSLNADTCVAEDVAYYNASLSGFLEDKIHLVDVVPIPLGICVGEDQFVALLEANQSVPATGSQIFTTPYDMQDRVSIQVSQGLRPLFKDNNLLGKFDLVIKKPGPRGEPQIDVGIHMDAEITVTTKDKETDEVQQIIFTREDASLSNNVID